MQSTSSAIYYNWVELMSQNEVRVLLTSSSIIKILGAYIVKINFI